MDNKNKKQNDLLNQNMDGATNEEKIAWLFRIIDNELEKPESKRDKDFILECSNYIKELMPEEEKYSEEELAIKLARLKDDADTNKYADSKRTEKPRRVGLKLVAVLSAVLILLFATLSIAAVASGYNNAFEYVSAKVSELLKMKPGDSKDEKGITIIRDGNSKKYNSIEELLKSENLDIMYPSVLPDDISINKISVIPEDSSNYVIMIQLSTDAISISVSNSYVYTLPLENSYSEYKSGYDNLFYIIDLGENTFQAICHKSGMEYIVKANDYHQMITIIENMKGS